MSDCDDKGRERTTTESRAAQFERRTYLKLAGGATSLSMLGTASASSPSTGSGYGYGGYGEGGYGESETGTGSNSPPVVDGLSADESSPPNPHAELTVDWAVSDPDGNLASVDIDVRDGGRSVESDRISVDGSSAAGSNDFRIKKGAGRTYDIVLTVSDTSGEQASGTDSASA